MPTRRLSVSTDQIHVPAVASPCGSTAGMSRSTFACAASRANPRTRLRPRSYSARCTSSHVAHSCSRRARSVTTLGSVRRRPVGPCRRAVLDPNQRERAGDEARERGRRQPERRREHVMPPAPLPTAAKHRDHVAFVHSRRFVLRRRTPIRNSLALTHCKPTSARSRPVPGSRHPPPPVGGDAMGARSSGRRPRQRPPLLYRAHARARETGYPHPGWR